MRAARVGERIIYRADTGQGGVALEGRGSGVRGEKSGRVPLDAGMYGLSRVLAEMPKTGIPRPPYLEGSPSLGPAGGRFLMSRQTLLPIR